VNSYFENDPVWLVNSSCAAPYPCIRQDEYNYYVNGDTLINGFTYVKIFKKGNYTFNWFSSPPVPPGCTGAFSYLDTIPACYLRSDNKQVFILPNLGASEALLYDFDLAPGDTLPLTYNNFEPFITVATIDSLYTPYGYRKRFILAGTTWSNELLEGIGHTRGFLEPLSVPLECGFDLICYSLNDTAWYPVNGPGCELNVGLQETNTLLNTVNLYPNPFHDYATISWKGNNKNVSIGIYNPEGKMVKFIEWLRDDHYEFHRGALIPGIYFYELRSDESSCVRGKMVITD
jgi:hypothetical protein